MRIYKFKDLTEESINHHFLDIVLKNTIWCARPDSLNDGNEFRFELNYEPSIRTPELLTKVVAKYRSTNFIAPEISAPLALANNRLRAIAAPVINDTIEKCRTNIGITSFSITKSDNHLWNEYGGKGNGVCIEINIPDHLIGHFYHRVNYVQNKTFHIDSFLESALFPDKAFATYKNILLTKTKKWEQEEEIRFIGNRQDVNLIYDGYISEITFGPKVPRHNLDKLVALITSHCSAKNISIKKLS